MPRGATATPKDYVRSRGTQLTVLNDDRCIQMMEDSIAPHPILQNEDIGEE